MLDYEKPLYQKGYKLIVGCDEAGRGPLCGPVVCAACIIEENYINDEINDSKKLTDKKRRQFLVFLLENFNCKFAIKCFTLLKCYSTFLIFKISFKVNIVSMSNPRFNSK